MSTSIRFIDSGTQAERLLDADDVTRMVQEDGNLLLVRAPAGTRVTTFSRVGQMISKAIGLRQEKRINAMIDAYLDTDPFDRIEALIDDDNAQLRAAFLQEFEMLDSAAVHVRAGHSGSNTAQTANGWKRAGRILSLPLQGKFLYPAFQFDADGQPLTLMHPVLAALPAHLSAWQRAFWLVSPTADLDGETPLDCIRTGKDRVISAAAQAHVLPAG